MKRKPAKWTRSMIAIRTKRGAFRVDKRKLIHINRTKALDALKEWMQIGDRIVRVRVTVEEIVDERD